MEIVIGIILVILAIYAIIYVVLPVMSIVLTAIIVIASVYGIGMAIYCLFKSLIENRDPYATYHDNHKNRPVGVRRNYFFGPGFHQVGKVITGMFSNLGASYGRLNQWRIKHSFGGVVERVASIIGYGVAVASTAVLGTLGVLCVAAVYVIIILLGMVVFFVAFLLLWLIDRIVLFFKSITNRCGNCKARSVIPISVCSCGTEHKLVPGPYGTFHRHCQCGQKLATTFLGGRSKYDSRCPHCGYSLVSGGSVQYGIQLVGKTESGKTAFLAAFWEMYKIWTRNQGIQIDVGSNNNARLFSDLENVYREGNTRATSELNASKYSIIHTLDHGRSVEMAIYDVAGELYDYGNSGVAQEQFRYCEGFIVLIDVFQDSTSIQYTLANFTQMFRDYKHVKSNKISNVPVAVVLTKADMIVDQNGNPILGYQAMGWKFDEARRNGHPDDYPMFLDEECKKVLQYRGFGGVISVIESAFSEVRYFGASPIGHAPDGTSFQPWGVTEPVLWLMSREKRIFKGMFDEQNS